MKRTIKVTVLTLFLTWIFNVSAIAQAPADPSIDTGANGPSQGVVGAGASINGGRYILFLLAAVYGGYKLIESRRKKEEEIETEA